MVRKSNVFPMTELHRDYRHITKDDQHILIRNWPFFTSQAAILYGNHRHRVVENLPFIQISQIDHQVYSAYLQ